MKMPEAKAAVGAFFNRDSKKAVHGLGLAAHIAELEGMVRQSGGDPAEFYQAAGISGDDAKLDTQLKKLSVLPYAMGRLDAGRTSPPTPTSSPTNLKTANPIAGLDHLVKLVEAKKTAEAKTYARTHRTAIIEQREGCLKLMAAQLEQERDPTKKYKLAMLARQLRDLPV